MLSQRAIIFWGNSCASPQFLQTKFRFAENATYKNPVPCLCSGTPDRPASKHFAYDRDVNQNLAPLRGVSPDRDAPKSPRRPPQLAQELIQPAAPPAFLFQGQLALKRKTQQKALWL